MNARKRIIRALQKQDEISKLAFQQVFDPKREVIDAEYEEIK